MSKAAAGDSVINPPNYKCPILSWTPQSRPIFPTAHSSGQHLHHLRPTQIQSRAFLISTPSINQWWHRHRKCFPPFFHHFHYIQEWFKLSRFDSIIITLLLSMMRVSVTQLLVTASLATALPQLQIPANNNNNNIFRSFPSSSGQGIQGEVSRVTIVEVGDRVTSKVWAANDSSAKSCTITEKTPTRGWAFSVIVQLRRLIVCSSSSDVLCMTVPWPLGRRVLAAIRTRS